MTAFEVDHKDPRDLADAHAELDSLRSSGEFCRAHMVWACACLETCPGCGCRERACECVTGRRKWDGKRWHS